MSCNSLNRQPEKYRLTVPSKGGFFYSNAPPPSYFDDVRNKERILDNTPTTCNRCSGTFPWIGSDPNHNNCFKNCTQPLNYKIDACEYENSLFRPRISNQGCQKEPSDSRFVMEYTNIPTISGFKISPNCGPQVVFNPPNPPSYINSTKKSDIIESTFGLPYSY